MKKSATKVARSRQAATLNLSPRAVETVATVRQTTGITQVAFLERLLDWFATQDPRIKTMILSPYAEVRRGLAKMVLEEMAANPHRDFDADRFDALIDHEQEESGAGYRIGKRRVAGRDKSQ